VLRSSVGVAALVLAVIFLISAAAQALGRPLPIGWLNRGDRGSPRRAALVELILAGALFVSTIGFLFDRHLLQFVGTVALAAGSFARMRLNKAG